MRDDNKKIGGKLYGVGIGPGDHRLLTLRAKEILDEVGTIFVPKAKDEGVSYARSIIEGAGLKSKNFVELTFLMTKDKEKLKAHWLRAAGKIAEVLATEKKAAFVTIGDPFIYSTYIYLQKTLRKNFPEIEVETIPGISAFNAAASSAGLPLVSGNERMAILPVRKDLKGIKEALEQFDTVVLMKVGAKLDKVIHLLKEVKLIRNAVLISRAGQPNERIVKGLSSLKDKESGYLSVIIVKRRNKDLK